jgi:hypothetical protein
MRYSKGTCSGKDGRYFACGKSDVYIVSKTRMQCASCYTKGQKKYKKIVYKRKKTGELDMFIKIWNSRPHFCEVSGDPIKEFDVRCFMHVLAKKAFGLFRLREDNIFMVLPELHHSYDFGNKEALRKDARWNKVFERYEDLKAEYYTINLMDRKKTS